MAHDFPPDVPEHLRTWHAYEGAQDYYRRQIADQDLARLYHQPDPVAVPDGHGHTGSDRHGYLGSHRAGHPVAD